MTQALLAFGQVAGSVLGWVTACKSSSTCPRHTRISCSPFWPRAGNGRRSDGAGIWRGGLAAFQIGRMAEEKKQFFNAYVAYAFALLFAAQAAVNMGVNTGCSPPPA